MKSFGSKDLVNCLQSLGFKKNKQHGTSHLKLSSSKPVPPGIRPFIIAILNKKTYDPHTQKSYLRQIKNLGYAQEEIEENMP